MMNKFVMPKINDSIITVGDEKSDVKGFDNLTIQLAVDAVNQRGGGTVRLSEGEFKVSGPVRLYSNVKLEGCGKNTILRKVEGYRTEFITDADYGELKAQVKDPSGLRPGMGIALTDSKNNSAWNVSTAVITKIEGDIIYFDSYLVRDYSSQDGGMVSNACSIIEAVNVSNCTIANLTVDGSSESNDFVDGCRVGGIYLHKAQDCLIENVTVKNFSGDGISWQLTDRISVRSCIVYACTNYGLHPGTGSNSSIIENCSLYNNKAIGLFVCWRVQNGSFKNNKIYNNGWAGISIGHKDTYNLFEGNEIFENGCCGVYVRQEMQSNGAHNNRYVNNVIRDNGNSEKGYGFLLDGIVKGTLIKNNTIRDSGSGVQKIGIAVKGNIEDYCVENNSISAAIKEVMEI
jgi:parallel beta-helix repeat protein